MPRRSFLAGLVILAFELLSAEAQPLLMLAHLGSSARPNRALEKGKHDCFVMAEDELWDFFDWYVVDAGDAIRLRALLGTCAAPLVSTPLMRTHWDDRTMAKVSALR